MTLFKWLLGLRAVKITTTEHEENGRRYITTTDGRHTARTPVGHFRMKP